MTTSQKPRLSAILITKNAAFHIDNCLKSIQWIEEIIVVDAGSTDSTVQQCQQYTDKIFIVDWPGFGVQKNRALAHAQGQWIFSIDADEEVSLSLKKEIEQAIQSMEYTAFRMPRLSRFGTRWIHHCGWQPDYVTRLFRRDCGRFTEDKVHEKVAVFQGKIGTLNMPLLHYTIDSLEQLLQKINDYSSLGAQTFYEKGKKGGLSRAILHGLWAFFRTYILKAGFLDGREGFIIAVYNAESTYYRYLKIMYLQNNKQ